MTGCSTANVRVLQKKDKNQPFLMGMANSPAVYWGHNTKNYFKKKRNILALTAPYPLTADYLTFK